VVVANHLSGVDIPAIFCAIPAPVAFVAKQEVERVPLLGQYMRSVGMIFLDRGRGEAALALLRQQARRVRQGRAQIVIFAEGKRSADGYVRLFKPGAFVLAKEAGVPIVPLAIAGADAVLGARPFDARPGVVRLGFAAPIAAEEVASSSVEALRDRTRAAIVALNRELGGKGGLDRWAHRGRGPDTSAGAG
jgi:1-acyl-sn-glycerol-3-phosphate acyltransferase